MTKVLIIEDDEVIRNMIRELLLKAGYRVSVAENGVEGVKLFKQGTFELIITDIIMPEKEGIETIMEIKRHSPDVKIIAVSGGGRLQANDYLDMAEKLGANRVFSKPFQINDFIKAVKELVGTP